jgi:hypothetical protein
MTQFGYEKLAAALVDTLEEGNFSRVGSVAANTAALATSSNKIPRSGPRGGQQRVDLSKNRQSWIMGSDTVAHRNHDDSSRQSGNSHAEASGEDGPGLTEAVEAHSEGMEAVAASGEATARVQDPISKAIIYAMCMRFNTVTIM